MSRTTLSVIVTALFFVCALNVQSLKVIPQRTSITYLNDKYVKYANISIKRYGRKSEYYVNFEGAKYHTWDNNVTFHLIFYEFLHNEYRRSFVEMHFKVCDMINKDPYLGRMIANYGIKCPVLNSELHMMNMTLPINNFPYVFPFEKARVDTVVSITKTGERIAEGYMESLFKN